MRTPIGIVLLLSTSTAALSQTADPSSLTTGLEEIVVTAEKRSENLQDVPASVVAFSQTALQNAGINNSVDLPFLTPGLLVSTNAAFGQPYLRGVGSDIINPGADSPVAVFVDNAYQARPTAAITDFYDVDRVEVLKGPQGTLYGRNASGGAMNIVTRDPDQTYSVDGDLEYGNYDQQRVRAAVNAPLGDDTAIRIAGYFSQNDGYVRNLYDGSRLDDENVAGIRGKLKYGFGGIFSLVLTAEYTHEDDTRNAIGKVLDTPALPLPVRDLAPLLGYTAPTIPADPFTVDFNERPSVFLEQTRLNAAAQWNFGVVELKSISGYTNMRTISHNDLDATQINFAYDEEADTSRTVTQSFQLSSMNTEGFRWITGLEYLHEDGGQYFDARLPLFGPPSPILIGPQSPIAGEIWDSAITTSAWAGFLEGSLPLTDKMTATAGVRYSWEKKQADFAETIVDPYGELTGSAGTFITPAHPDDSWKAWTPKFRFEYRPEGGILMYASATRGFKSGGFNLMNTAETFQPEKIWSYEVGLKADWLDNRLQTNVAAFYYDYKNLQVNQFSGVTNLITNAASSRITGLETEFVAKPAKAVQTDLSVAYLDAQYLSYYTENANVPGNPVLNLSGNRMPKAPKMTVTAGTEVSTLVADAGKLTARGEIHYQSLVYFDQFDTPQLTQGGYALLNGRLSFEPRGQSWHVALFGRNLANKVYRQSMVRVDDVFGTEAFYGAPRTYGVEVGGHY
jgi:iron complex outermembrane recepter protein